MNGLVLLTGANGHLGRTVASLLVNQGWRVRGLVLPNEKAPFLEAAGVSIVRGDVRDRASLLPLFKDLPPEGAVVIHAAAVIDITSAVSKMAYEVNVQGTKNMVQLALMRPISRFIHVSSVHAIPEAPNGNLICETKRFSARQVEGGYAKTKAEASRYVMMAVDKWGLPAIILHPAGIIGPGDTGSNNIVSVLRSYLEGRIPACPRGGYNLVDVRDVAAAVIAAIHHGRVGETYILSGNHWEFRQLFTLIRQITGRGRRCAAVPMWLARLAAPLLEKTALRQHRRPLVTPYSLRALASNDNFTHEKATRELGFSPRPLYATLTDTLASLQA